MCETPNSIFGWTQNDSKNLPQDLHLLLLVQNIPRHQQAQEILLEMPGKEEIHEEVDFAGPSPNSGMSQSLDPCKLIQPHDHS
jgi:hypothetical protein